MILTLLGPLPSHDSHRLWPHHDAPSRNLWHCTASQKWAPSRQPYERGPNNFVTIQREMHFPSSFAECPDLPGDNLHRAKCLTFYLGPEEQQASKKPWLWFLVKSAALRLNFHVILPQPRLNGIEARALDGNILTAYIYQTNLQSVSHRLICLTSQITHQV